MENQRDRSDRGRLREMQDGPWHEGELALQAKAGAVEKMAAIGDRYIRPHLTEQHRSFFPELPFLVIGTVDDDGYPWATIRDGSKGFLCSPDEWSLVANIGIDTSDPAEAGLHAEAAIGWLGIQLETRRRNRVNGVLRSRTDRDFELSVEHTFGNCPRYIQQREEVISDEHEEPGEPLAISIAEIRRIVEIADTFFVASYVDDDIKNRHVDVSHRGGQSGFVRFGVEGELTIPDYNGNHYFNTLGNILTNPSAGLVFPDFSSGALLQMTGRAAVLLDSEEMTQFPGAERLWRFSPAKTIYRRAALRTRFRNRTER
ncbi:pyridoxamine 5'-phosphate oxidase family protein [Neorhizobium petrolearium]|nr:pyridoxamine 5'-phosphate oxidase family protein [Neorhizobium petrolearium]MCC2613725.1 pyridoxamine 5'-phosphate oxidase family protein [Neorhizobium petrolearium]WGI72037.1 pyridoxamine 5'-phosphate oxidase family protein [Neorhizobium petrolearium]